MGVYQKNRLVARIRNIVPTKTEQSGARETDINVIIGKFKISGRVPAPAGDPIYGDFTTLPGDLRGMIEEAKSIKDRRTKLPPELRDMPIEELLSLTPDKLTTILSPVPKESPNSSQHLDKPSSSTS